MGGKRVASGFLAEEQMQVLVTVKAYPQPSRTYGEMVCVAGVRTDAGEPTIAILAPARSRPSRRAVCRCLRDISISASSHASITAA